MAVLATVMILRKQSQTLQNEIRNDLFGDENTAAVYTDLLGNPVNLDSFAGKVMVINSWASWSPLSQTELVSLQSLAAEFSEVEVVFLAINRREPKEQAVRFVETLTDISLLQILIDTTDHYYGAVGGYAMPETRVYDRSGIIISEVRGAFDREELKRLITEAVEKQ